VIAHEANNRESTQSSRSLPFVAILRVLDFLLDGYYRQKLLGGSCILRPAFLHFRIGFLSFGKHSELSSFRSIASLTAFPVNLPASSAISGCLLSLPGYFHGLCSVSCSVSFLATSFLWHRVICSRSRSKSTLRNYIESSMIFAIYLSTYPPIYHQHRL
jgi:hypothetical protein